MFSNNDAIVIGPTPFGTGEIYDAISDTSLNFTSPINFPSTLLIPISTTTASFSPYQQL